MVEQALENWPLLWLMAVGVEVKVHHWRPVSPVAGTGEWGPAFETSFVHINVWMFEKDLNYSLILFGYS